MRRIDDQRPEPDNDVEAVEQLLSDRYGELSARVRRFARGQPVFAVERTSGDPWVVRVGHRLDRYAAALDVLRRVGYRAARVVPDSTGALVGRFDETHDDGSRSVLVVTHVPGRPTPFEPSTLAGVGKALGLLHSAGSPAIKAAQDPLPGLPILERAGMLPANELAFGLRCLAAVEDQLPPPHREKWAELVAACEGGLEFGRGLTTVFLHGDAHPWNSVIDDAGEVSLIDWDSSGPGPAVIDLGFLVLSCDAGPLIDPVVPPDPRRLSAVVAAYREHMQLSDADLAALDDAVAFRVLVAAAVGFSSMIRQGRDPTDDVGVVASLQRWAMAPSIARRMRQEFGFA
ncbi:MAG TPA: phosphotransferase [Actinopolymorphaceae bacterium]|jgi:Ser/Thr protein kinase RdoA (MazF antagonist)